MDETILLEHDPKSLSIDQLIIRLTAMDVEVSSKRKAKAHYIKLYTEALGDSVKRNKLLGFLMYDVDQATRLTRRKRKRGNSEGTLL
jgi:hypothetical protein